MTVTGEIKILTMSGEFKYLGDAGPSGPRGETGNGIQEIVKTDTQGLIDTYTITYTNGNTVTFTITNGRNGENGTDGRDGLTTSVNGIEQEGGNVDINLDNIPDGSIRKILTNAVNDLLNYYNKSETDTLLSTKVDKEEGKGLSTNDYTTEEKNKLEGLENYDDTQIQEAIANKNDLFQVITIPENPTDGDLIQYIGETNEDYGYGHFYKFIQGNPENAVGTTDSMTIYDITVNLSQFKRQIPMVEERDYVFSYYIDMDTLEGYWDFEMMPVDIADFGISYNGDPSEGDIITVTYNKATVSRWSEQEIQSGTQFKEMPTPSEKTYGKLIQYIGETYIDDMLLTPITYTKGHFYETVIYDSSNQYIEDPTVDENTVGTYYTRRGINRYIEVTLPGDYIEGTTYYIKVEVSDYEFKEVSVSPQVKRKYIDDMMELEQSGEVPDITVTVYDNDVNYNTLVELYANNDDTFTWISENMVNNIIDEYDGSFSFRVKQNLPIQYSMYYTITPIEVEGGML